MLTFPWCADEQAKSAEVMVLSYFWRGYQQPCDIGLSDRTSVVLNTPLTLLGQAFLSVSRHTAPSHHAFLSFSLSQSFPVMVDPLWLWVGGQRCACACMCVPSAGVEAGPRETSAAGRCGRQGAGQSSLRGP